MYTEWMHDYMALHAENRVLYNADQIIMMQAAQQKYEKYKYKITFYNKITFLDICLNPLIAYQNTF